MSKVIRKIKEVEIRRDDIVNAALKVIKKNGIHNSTMNDIAKEAEFTKKSLYSYFSSKEEIYVSIFIKFFKVFTNEIEEKITKVNTGLEKIELMGMSYYEFYSENPEVLTLMLKWDLGFWNYDRIKDELRHELKIYIERAIKRIRNSFLLGIEDGSIRKDIDVHSVIFYYLFTVRIILFQSIIGHFSKEKNFFIQYLKLFIRAIKSNE